MLSTKKPTSPPPVVAAAPAFVPPEILSVRVRVEQVGCFGCKDRYIDALGMSMATLITFLDGSAKPPAGFVTDANACFDLVERCPSCKK